MYRRVTLAAIAAAAAVVGIGAAPAVAAPGPTATTNITFAITGGALTINAPDPVNLGNGLAGGTISGDIGPVVVSDQRGALLGSWTASVSTTPYTTGGGTPAETIPAAAATYTPGLATFTGIVVPVAGAGGTLGTTKTAYLGTLITGNNTVTWHPNLSIAVPAAAVAGTYHGLVTHSVA